VVVTGASGLIGFPFVLSLGPHNDVTAVARFREKETALALVQAGVSVVPWDLADPDLDALPEKADVVVHLGAVTTAAGWPENRVATFENNVRATGRLMSRYRGARFVYASSGSTYAFQGERTLREDDPHGLHNGLETYAASKIAAEQLVAFLAEEWSTPAVILRIFSAYGPRGGAPTARVDQIARGVAVKVFPEIPNRYCPIFETDYVDKLTAACHLASTPPLTVNFAGSEVTTVEDYCRLAGGLLGIEPVFEESRDAPYPLWPDTTKMEMLLGPTRTSVAEGIAAVVKDRGGRALAWSSWNPGDESRQ
jgi:nucleoside-diphosphate-sugar epimerase